MIHGFVVVDKPAGITSHDVVSRIRRIFGTRKVGHTGTLDPFATGVLPIALNDGTKAIPFLDEGVKTYEALVRLGVTTDTLDMTGEVLSETDPGALTRDQIETCLNRFTGSISQTPPMYSAIKQNGQPLYKLARQGVEVERKSRMVEIHSLQVLSCAVPYVSIRVTCSRGTYVRSLADDIGRQLGCGAALQELRRTASGFFTISSAQTLESLEKAAATAELAPLVLSPLAALGQMTECVLNDRGVTQVSFGRMLHAEDLEEWPGELPVDGALVRLSSGGKLKAVAEIGHGSDDVLQVILKRVFM